MLNVRSSASALVLAIALALPLALVAQIRSGAIVGAVRDPQGAAVPAAQVQVIEERTNNVYTLETGESGEFTQPYLPAGVYTVSVEAEGFSPSRRTGITLNTAETVRADIALEIGSVDTAVTVSAEAVSLQTESSTIQGAVNETVIKQVPNIQNNPFYYATLQAGVVGRGRFNDSQDVTTMGIGTDARRNFSAISVNGGQAFSNDVTLDGVTIQGSGWNEVTILPNPEGLQEVRVLNNNFSAEYGRAQGVISATTKSGTNELHGSAFYRKRHDALNANSFLNNARGFDRPEFDVNSFGGTVGGPVKKDQAFFFVSYEGFLHDRSIDFLRTVPTDAEKNGDFSNSFVNVSGQPRNLQVFDPFAARQLDANTFEREIIPNSILPASRLNPGALNLINEYPGANNPADDFTNANNFFRRDTQDFSRDSVNSRFDLRLGNKHSLYFTGGFMNGTIDTPGAWGDASRFYSRNQFVGAVVEDRNYFLSVGDTIIFSPSWVMDVRVGVNRVRTRNQALEYDDFDYDRYGIPADFQAARAVDSAPHIAWGWNRFSALDNSAYLFKNERQTNSQLVAGVTHNRGKWTHKFGAEVRSMLSNYADAQSSVSIRGATGNGSGIYPLTTADGRRAGNPDPWQGNDAWSSALLGVTGNYDISNVMRPALLQNYAALYTQNDWRATDRLTVNLGLRWDWQPGPTERFDRLSSFSFRGDSPFGSPGEIVFPGNNRDSRRLWRTRMMDFGPRVGLAYRVTDKTVVRAGYGLTYIPSNTGFFGGPWTYGMDPFSPNELNQRYGPNPAGIVVATYDQPGFARVLNGPGADGGNPVNYGQFNQPRMDYDDYLNGKSQQYNFTIQHSLTPATALTIGFAGTRGNHLPYHRVPLNQDELLPDSVLNQFRDDYIARGGRGSLATDQVANPFQPDPNNLLPFLGPFANATVPLINTLMPWPLFNNLRMQRSIGWSNYNSLILGLQHRSDNLTMQTNYTFSKAMDFTQSEAATNGFAEGTGYNIGPLNARDWRDNYAPSGQDVRHRFVLSMVYDLPFGRGQRFETGSSVLDAIVGGWNVGSVWLAQSGFPININGLAAGSLNGRPDIVPGADLELPENLQGWYDGQTSITLPSGRQFTPCNFCYQRYNPDAFQGRVIEVSEGNFIQDNYWFGNAANRYIDFRNPNRFNVNLSVGRTFRIAEGKDLQFQAQATNLLNGAQFRSFNGGLGATNVRNRPERGEAPGFTTNNGFGTHNLNTFDPRQVELRLTFRF